MRSIRTTLAGPAAAAALVVALVGCASGVEGDGSAGEDAATPPPTSAAAPPPTSPAPTGPPATPDEAAAETAFRGYYQALLARDFSTACSLNAPETNQRLLDSLAAQGGPAASCEEAFAQIYAMPGSVEISDSVANTAEIQDVVVQGEAATVSWFALVGGRQSPFTSTMRLIDGQWRLVNTTSTS